MISQIKKLTFLTTIFCLIASCGPTTPSSGTSDSSTKTAEQKSKSIEFTTAKIIRKLPHATDSYTQGLLVNGGKIYESTGEYGSSTLRRVDIESGKIEAEVKLPKQYFGEGLALYDGKLYQLTWMEGVCFVYDAKTLKQINTLKYNGEGWGLVAYNDKLLLSDGTSTIKVIDPKNLSEISRFDVRDSRGNVKYINELEIIDDMLYANIYTSTLVAVIDPLTGEVKKYIDCTPLAKSIGNATEADVLNGIAYDSVTGKAYMTGKLWDTMFEVEF